MGEVFWAEHVLAGRPVALKILRPELSENEDVTRRFFQEAQAVNKIRHPNIVDVIDAGFSESGPYIAMELLVGESSARTLARLGKLPVEAVIAIGLSVLGALEVAHDAGIIHRDLKPENVYLHRPPGAASVKVKLLDFGIAKVLAPMGPTPRTMTGVVFGTPDYLSPEQANGDFSLDGRSDLFAVGVLLFELLTGTRPFRAATAVATAYKIVHAAAPKLVDAGGPEHPMLEAVLARALRKRPDERYSSVGVFARELELVVPDAKARLASLDGLLGAAPAESATWRSPNAQPVPGPSVPPRSAESSAAPSSHLLRSKRRQGPLSAGKASTSSPLPSPRTPASSSLRPETLSEPPFVSEPPRSAPISQVEAKEREPIPGARLRGSILRAIDRTVVRRHGILLRAGILDRLPPSYAKDFRYSAIAGAILYGLDVFETYATAVGELVGDADSTYWREIGRASAERELSILLRPLYRSADDVTLLRRGTSVWSKLLDFGTWKVRQDPSGKITIHIGELSPAPTALRHWLVGMIEQTLWSAGFRSAVLLIANGDYSPASDLVLEISSGRRR